MTQIEKLIQKFLKRPGSVSYSEIKKILLRFGFECIDAKGSHKKFKHPMLERDLIIPLHSNDCKNFYKEQTAKIIEGMSK